MLCLSAHARAGISARFTCSLSRISVGSRQNRFNRSWSHLIVSEPANTVLLAAFVAIMAAMVLAACWPPMIPVGYMRNNAFAFIDNIMGLRGRGGNRFDCPGPGGVALSFAFTSLISIVLGYAALQGSPLVVPQTVVHKDPAYPATGPGTCTRAQTA